MANPEKAYDKKTPEELVKIARNNHIWINAMSAVNPSDELLIDIGAAVIQKIRDSDMRDGLGISRMTIFTANMS